MKVEHLLLEIATKESAELQSEAKSLPPPPPLRMHQQGQENDGHTGSWCLDKVVLAHSARHQKDIC